MECVELLLLWVVAAAASFAYSCIQLLFDPFWINAIQISGSCPGYFPSFVIFSLGHTIL